MKYEIVYLPLVFEDIKETNDFYNSRVKGLGKEFVIAVKKEFKAILKNPLLFEIKYKNTRIAFTKRFPFGIHFEIQENSNRIVVKGVYHTSRNSELWYSR
ncbi:type II toxin-antitoxin system RelE/ParE family toxin [Flavobacterium limnophilum]|uniref:type II toxin-antitoxin system RelE/ParE family toxin n=1 Tax=Flavobacterium limnophilum TaxID=3003262 RepID=UPI0022AC3195|nr:type II toxin-antitoxin system RelE/ParE family toxin [Flavobacterium limnophilum]